MKKNRTTLISVCILLVLWQIAAMLVHQPELMPTIPRLLMKFYSLLITGAFYQSLAMTLLRGAIGMLLSFFTALLLSSLFVRIKWLYELFRPILTIMRSVPVISFILLALIFLHTESIPLLIGFLTMFPLLTENLTKGFGNLRPELSVMARQFRIGRWNYALQIIYPQLKPLLYSGLASAAGFGWRAIIMGEVLSQCTLGIGSQMKRAQVFIDISELLVWTIIAIIISFITDKGIEKIAKYRPPIFFPATQKKGTSLSPDKSLMPAGEPIKLTGVSYRYGISDFSYLFESGKIYGISAPSGTGKTTLLNLINGTLIPTTGTVSVNREKGIASLFQEPELLPHLTVLENIILPLSRFYPIEEARIQAGSILIDMELFDYAARYPDELSYGQQQRTAMARALVYPSPFLLMDEPFKGLDNALSLRIIERIRAIQSTRHQTILFTAHQSEELKAFADKVISLPVYPGEPARTE